MAHAAMHAGASDVLHSHPKMDFAVGRYHYEIKTDARHSLYSVTDGTHTLTNSLLWAFGTARAGQSYLFKKDDGNFYEARVTYFSTLKTLGFTPARALASPKDLQEAMYRPVDAAEVRRCFACHTTASSIGEQFDEKKLAPGVGCEACHGPGAAHIAFIQGGAIPGASNDTPKHIFNPAQLIPVDSVDFCGACHASWWDVRLSGVKGVSTTRSQPYRLELSKCWGKGDARLTCIGCHDPHQPLQTNPAAYDGTCLSCHIPSGAQNKADHPGVACPVGDKNCVSCHMQKVYVPEMHYKFTDHRIRIAHSGEPFPE
jgi:cytochrome c554/c'-like protein